MNNNDTLKNGLISLFFFILAWPFSVVFAVFIHSRYGPEADLLAGFLSFLGSIILALMFAFKSGSSYRK